MKQKIKAEIRKINIKDSFVNHAAQLNLIIQPLYYTLKTLFDTAKVVS